MEKKYFEIENPAGEIINGDVRRNALAERAPIVLIAHGFKGFKDWGFIPYLAEQIAKAGFIAVNFNFSLNGSKRRDDLFIDVEEFSRNTISAELDDVLFLIDRLGEILSEDDARAWNGDVYLLGHSLGGGVCILAAARSARVKKAALWASVARFDRYTARQKKEWRSAGFIQFPNSRTGQILEMKLEYLLDLERNKENFSLVDNLQRVNLPLLIVHGLQDFTVPVRESKTLAAAVKPERLNEVYIDKTGHTFGVEHPFTTPNDALNKAIMETIDFLNR